LRYIPEDRATVKEFKALSEHVISRRKETHEKTSTPKGRMKMRHLKYYGGE
jgi:hypothetical protein